MTPRHIEDKKVTELNEAESCETSALDDEKEFTTAEAAIAQWKAEGKTFGGAAETLKRMRSKLVGGPGGGSTRSGVSRKSKIITGNLRRGRYS